MRLRLAMLAGLLVGTLIGADARAHFLFVRLGPPAEGGRTAEVFFSERADAGDPKFVAKIGGTKLWAQGRPGAFRPLEVNPAADRLRARVPAGAAGVVGECQYGVLARPGQVPFLLRYFPKAVAGDAEAINHLKPRPEAPLEIAATVEGDRVRLVALADGKPQAGAAFHIVDEDLAEEELKAGPDGAATWTPSASGRYSAYFRHDTKASGEVDGKKYEEIRSFATLALDWPLAPTEADPEAVALFREALAARAWWRDFPGFSAEVAGDLDGRPIRGRAAIDRAGNVTATGLDAEARTWVEGQLASVVRHRLADGSGDDTPVLTFGPEAGEHPLGRLLVVVGGRFASSYRVKDKELAVVNRHVGRSALTITALENERNPEGRLLPRGYAVRTWDDETGALRRVETVHDRWVRVEAFDLPAARTVTTASDAGLSVRQLRLSGHELNGSESARPAR